MRQLLILCLVSMTLFSVVKAQSKAPEVAATGGTLTVTATVSYTSPYMYTVWIKDSQGSFVRTLSMYGVATQYYSELTNWYASSAANKVNAVTGATKTSISTITSTWNAKDQTNTSIMADGNYTVGIEMAGENYAAKYVSGVITKGTSAQTVNPSNVSPIMNVSLKWTPSVTGLDEVSLSKLYTIYPNPTKSDIFVNGFGIRSVTVYSLSGKQLMRSVLPKLELASLSAGTYMIQIETSVGTFTKKLVKE